MKNGHRYSGNQIIIPLIQSNALISYITPHCVVLRRITLRRSYEIRFEPRSINYLNKINSSSTSTLFVRSNCKHGAGSQEPSVAKITVNFHTIRCLRANSPYLPKTKKQKENDKKKRRKEHSLQIKLLITDGKEK